MSIAVRFVVTFMMPALAVLGAPPGFAQDKANDAVRLELVGQLGGPAAALSSDGMTAVVGLGSGLVRIAGGDDAIQIKGIHPLAGRITSALATGYSTWVVLDGSQLTHLDEAGRTTAALALPGEAVALARGEGVIVVVLRNRMLLVVQTGVGSEPKIVGRCPLLGEPRDLSVAGSLALVASGSEGVELVDLANADSPRRVGGYHVSGSVNAIVGAGGKAFAALDRGGVLVLDCINPAAVRLLDTVKTPEVAARLAVCSAGVVAVCGAKGLIGIRPEAGDRWQAVPLVQADAAAAVVPFGRGILLLTRAASAPTVSLWMPNPRGEFAAADKLYLPGAGQSVAVAGKRAYLADFSSQVRVLDVANPVRPMPIGVLEAETGVSRCRVLGNWLGLLTGSGLELWAISGATPPRRIARHSAPGGIQDVAVFGRTLVVVSSPEPRKGFGAMAGKVTGPEGGERRMVPSGTGQLELLAVEENQPSLRSLGHVSLTAVPVAIALAGPFAYVIDVDAGLNIIQLDGASGPRLCTRFHLTGRAQSIAACGSLVVLNLEDGGGLAVIDTAESARPRLVQSLAASKTSGVLTSFAGGVLLGDVADRANALRVFAWQGQSLRECEAFRAPGAVADLCVSDGCVFVADRHAGLLVYRVIPVERASKVEPVPSPAAEFLGRG